MQRLVIAALIVVALGIGAFRAAARAAGGKPNPPRIVTLRIGDTAVIGKIQCLATSDTRGHPMEGYYLRCGNRPHSSARYWADVFPGRVIVAGAAGNAGNGTELYHTPS